MKKIFIVLFAFGTLLAGNYNKTLTTLHAKIFHKIILLDKDLKTKVVDGHVIIHILYEESDYYDAKNFRDLIKKFIEIKYPYPSKIKLVEYKNIQKIKTSTALFLLDSSKKSIREAVEVSKKLKVISYSYNPDFLELGVVLSLDVGKTIKPYINFNSVKENQLRFNPIIIRISKGYNQ